MKRFNGLHRVRIGVLAAALAVAAAAATTLVLADSAGAIPAAQSGCLFSDPLTLTPGNPQTFDLRRQVTVSSPRTVKVEVTSDIGVDPGAEVRIEYSVNFSSPDEGMGVFGPANFANHQEFFETRTTFALIPVGSGTTTIEPFVVLNGPSSARATLLARCLTIEASTS